MAKIIKLEQANCAPCKMVSQALDTAGLSYEAINIFDEPEKTEQFGLIMSVPVTILMDDEGNEIIRSEGYKPDQLQKIIELAQQ